jgi:hypothetical protein
MQDPHRGDHGGFEIEADCHLRLSGNLRSYTISHGICCMMVKAFEALIMPDPNTSSGIRSFADECAKPRHREYTYADVKFLQPESTLQTIFRAAPIGIGLVTNRVLGWVNDRLCILLGKLK